MVDFEEQECSFLDGDLRRRREALDSGSCLVQKLRVSL